MLDHRCAAGVVLEHVEQIQKFWVGQGVDVQGRHRIPRGTQRVHGGGDGTRFHASNIRANADRNA